MTDSWRWLKRGGRLLRSWALVSGRDVVETTRASLLSLEARVGAGLLAFLGVLGWYQAGPWAVLGPSLGGETLSVARSWHRGELFLWGVALLLLLALIGALWGVAVRNAWRFIGRLQPRADPDRFRPLAVGFASAFAILAAHGTWLWREMGRHPALFQEAFSGAGFAGFLWGLAQGAGRGKMGALAVVVGGTIGILAGLEIVQRLRRWFLAFSRPTRIAIGVLGGALLLFGAGLRGVRWVKRERNTGPNVLLISVDGLRSGDLENEIDAPRFTELASASRVWARCVPPSPDLAPTLATALTGRSPLVHQVRHEFPAARDLESGPETLAGLLRRRGFYTAVLSDGPHGYFSRVAGEFDEARAAGDSLRARLARRALERSPHLLPYLGGAWGRRLFPPLRGSRALADPALLAREAEARLATFRNRSTFFLWVHFSCLSFPVEAVSPSVARRLAAGDIARPSWDGLREQAAGPEEWARRGRARKAALAALDQAVGSLLKGLRRRRLDRSTAVILWSPRATALSAKEEASLDRLGNGPLFEAPLLWRDPLRPSVEREDAPVRAVDVPSLAAGWAGVEVPEGWEGSRIELSPPGGESGLVFVEARVPFLLPLEPPDWSLHPPLVKLLMEDRHAPGHWCVDPAWEDATRVGRDRLMQVDQERLVYRPGRRGAVFEYYRLDQDPEARRDLSGSRAHAARAKELEEMFFRHMARETGWRPQNDYWIPDAFLRERPREDPPR